MPGFKDTLLESLRMAALFTEEPENRFHRLSVENRQYETDQRIRQNDERLRQQELDRQDRMTQRGRDNERQDLETKLKLNQAGVRLTPEQRAARERGEDFGVDMGGGVNIGAAGGDVVDFGGESTFIPGREAQGMIDLQRELEKENALRQAKTIAIKSGALPGILGQVIGDDQDIRVEPQQLGSILNAVARVSGEGRPNQSLDKMTFTGADNMQERIYIDPETGEINRVPLGKTRSQQTSSSEGRLAAKAKTEQRVQQEASRIFLEAGGDAQAAMDSIAQQAEFSDDDFLRENAVDIAHAIRLLNRKDNEDPAVAMARLLMGGGENGELDPAIANQLGVAGTPQSSGAKPVLGGANVKKQIDDYLKIAP